MYMYIHMFFCDTVWFSAKFESTAYLENCVHLIKSSVKTCAKVSSETFVENPSIILKSIFGKLRPTNKVT